MTVSLTSMVQFYYLWVQYAGPYLGKMIGGGGANTDCVAKGHGEGEGAGGGSETTSILQSEWEAKKRSIATIIP